MVGSKRIGASPPGRSQNAQAFRLALRAITGSLAFILLVVGLAAGNATIAAGGGMLAVLFGLLFVDRFF